MKNIMFLGTLLAAAVAARAQQKTDTVIVSLGKTSQIIFTMEDRSDVDILRHYDFQELFDDILLRLGGPDTTGVAEALPDTNEAYAEDETAPEQEWWSDSEDEDEDERDYRRRERRHRSGSTRQSTNLDFGINNYLDADHQLPDASLNHAVRPWGSWYVALTSLQRTRIASKFFVEWGFGVSWYNFKFENNLTTVVRNPGQVDFVAMPENPDYHYIKSKLRVTHLNFSLVPVIDFNDRGSKPRMWNDGSRAFRLGVGPYVGYKIGSKTKKVYEEEDGDKKKQKVRDGYYLNDFRYGVRVQLGFRSTDFFFNYDLNELFKTDRGPTVNAVSFGIIF